MPKHRPRPIGGYFELELPDNHSLPYSGSIRFQSARAAFLSLLRAVRPQRVWIPKYICNAMICPLSQENIECIWYDLNDQLDVDDNVKTYPGDWLLYVNYFGICNDHIPKLFHRFQSAKIVLDYSQSFFTPPADKALATIYSPRKFLGIPDGGLLITRASISLPETQDTHSIQRATHLMRRLADSPEAGYAKFKRAEDSLADFEPKRMSKLTERLLSSVDFHRTSMRRSENFFYLHERLGDQNRLPINISQSAAPLCYPYVCTDSGLRSELISNKIFVPTYWHDAINRVSRDWAEKMIRYLLPLPIDQRYDTNDMSRLVSIIANRTA